MKQQKNKRLEKDIRALKAQRSQEIGFEEPLSDINLKNVQRLSEQLAQVNFDCIFRT